MRLPSAAAPTRTPAPRWVTGLPSRLLERTWGSGPAWPNPNRVRPLLAGKRAIEAGVGRQCGGVPVLESYFETCNPQCAFIYFWRGVLKAGRLGVRFRVCGCSCPRSGARTCIAKGAPLSLVPLSRTNFRSRFAASVHSFKLQRWLEFNCLCLAFAVAQVHTSVHQESLERLQVIGLGLEGDLRYSSSDPFVLQLQTSQGLNLWH